MKGIFLKILLVSLALTGCRNAHKLSYLRSKCPACVSGQEGTTLYYEISDKKTYSYCLYKHKVDSFSFRPRLHLLDGVNPFLHATFAHYLQLEPIVTFKKHDESKEQPIFRDVLITDNFIQDSIIYGYFGEHGQVWIFPVLDLRADIGHEVSSFRDHYILKNKYRDTYGFMNYELHYYHEHPSSTKHIFVYNHAVGVLSEVETDKHTNQVIVSKKLVRIGDKSVDEYLRNADPESLLLFDCPRHLPKQKPLPPDSLDEWGFKR